MKDSIYVVDPGTRRTVLVSPTSFWELKVRDRQDLQAWLMNAPEVLGEPLLLITSEFDRFDKSDKRLDLLLLDREGKLVVAELKLDASGSWADQQAIRYAAFCSTMTMEDVVDLYGGTAGRNREEAVSGICEFLSVDSLPELGGEPRIILVAGSFQDQELTSTVMWLRKFGVDISCVELTPYRYPGDEANVLLVPKTLIPLPEAREYQVRVERKERSEIGRQDRNQFVEFFGLLLRSYAAWDPAIPGPRNPSSQSWMSLNFGNGQLHYEWLVRRRTKVVDVALHFEAPAREINLSRLEELLLACPDLEKRMGMEMSAGPWGRRYASLSFSVPHEGDWPGQEAADRAAEVMVRLVGETFEAVKRLG